MSIEEWAVLKTGDKIQHIEGDVETIYVDSEGIQYIEGKNKSKVYNLFPLTEFDHNEWRRI